jgi:hypothetical protein
LTPCSILWHPAWVLLRPATESTWTLPAARGYPNLLAFENGMAAPIVFNRPTFQPHGFWLSVMHLVRRSSTSLSSPPASDRLGIQVYSVPEQKGSPALYKSVERSPLFQYRSLWSTLLSLSLSSITLPPRQSSIKMLALATSILLLAISGAQATKSLGLSVSGEYYRLDT